MSSLALSYWDSIWVLVAFDPKNNSIKRRLNLRKSNVPTSGMAHKEKGHWFVVYKSGTSLAFFFDGAIYALEQTELRIDKQRTGNALITILCDGRALFSTPISGSILLDFPTTKHERDQESFFVWMKALAEDSIFREDMMRVWSNKVDQSRL